MGYSTSSNTFRVIGENGPVAARSMTRRSQAERWDAEALAKARVGPGTSYVPTHRGQVRFNDPAAPAGATTDSIKTAGMLKLRINQSDLDEYGYYAACPQCTHVQRHGRPRAGATHTEECRQRIIEHLKLSEVGRARLELQEGREQQAQEEKSSSAPKPV